MPVTILVLGICSEQKHETILMKHLVDRDNKEISKIYRLSDTGKCYGEKQGQGGIILGPGA